jgi:membrane associated rhomboid family serine protease
MLQVDFQMLTPTVKKLMIACGAVFLLQFLMPFRYELGFLSFFGLGVEGIARGWFWQFATYAFLHGSFFHLLMNMIGLFFLGPELERHLGARHFFIMFMFSAVIGGIGWLALTWPFEGICIGASGGVFGLIGAFAGLFPHRQLTLLVFFVLPVTMPAWLLAVLFGVMQLAYLLTPGESGIAYAAHLAGGVAGYLFTRVMFRPGRIKAPPFASPFGAPPPPPPRPSAPTRAEIDAILDKISRDGLHALTPRERDMLQKVGRAHYR